MINKLSRLIPRPKRDCIYEIVGLIQPGLCLDIGAAAGEITKEICQLSGEQTRVVAFEPFPGNHAFFENTVENLPNDISLVKKAVSDRVGWSKFLVPSVVQGTESGWEELTGYSSVGFLNEPEYNTVSKYLKWKIETLVRSVLKRQKPDVLQIRTTTIDTEFPDEKIDFIKMDVQGAEAKVLKGAKSALSEGRIGILYIEWSGDKNVLDILSKYGYEVYDSTYVVGNYSQDKAAYKEIGFEIIGELSLSTGATAYEMVLMDDGDSPEQAVKRIKQQKLGWVQTDLIVVHPNVKSRFLAALESYSSTVDEVNQE